MHRGKFGPPYPAPALKNKKMYIEKQKMLIAGVKPVETTKDGKYKYRNILLRKPAFVDAFGEKHGEDDLFECSVWNKKIDTLPALIEGDKVEVSFFLQGREYVHTSRGLMYSLRLNIHEIELID